MTVFTRQVMLEILLGVVCVVVAKAAFNIPYSTFSLTNGFVKKTAWRYTFRAFVLGILATFTLLAFHASGIPVMKQFQPYQLLTVLFMASVSEELLSRGLVQGMVRNGVPIIIAGRLKISSAVIAGASVFSLIHLSIYITGGDALTTIIIMLYAFVLGIVAGKAREQSNLGAAILTHMLFNVGGIAGGIVTNIISMATTRHFIQH